MSDRGVLFVGSKALALAQLEALGAAGVPIRCAALLDDRDDERSVIGELEALTGQLGVPAELVANGKDLSAVVAKHRPDLAFVCGWYRILPRTLLESVPLGWLGVHASALPAYRGFSPLVWALLNGESSVGVSLFQITEGLDEGGLFDQRHIEVGSDDQIGEVLEKVAELSGAMARDAIPAVLAGSLLPRPQPATTPSYCAARTPDDGLLSWDRSAQRVHDAVRAQSRPYPGAFTFLDGRRVTIWRARRSEMVAWGEPGSVVRITEDGVDVACADGTAVTLLEVQVAGEPARPAPEVVRSVRVRFGRP
jgi:methionyl-tRNA formyltransferase